MNNDPQPSSTSHPPPSSPPIQHDTDIPARKRYAHLYTPFLTALFILLNRPILSALTSTQTPTMTPLIALTALPTHLVASLFYPPTRPPPSAPATRFSRTHIAARALVLFLYGRIYGTKFTLPFFLADLWMSYVLGTVVGERPSGTPQRRSEFLVAMLWVAGSGAAWALVPPQWATLALVLGMLDRTVWRAAWVALVDDVVGVLSRPELRTWRGRVVTIGVQAVVIWGVVWFGAMWVIRVRDTELVGKIRGGI